MTVHWTVLLATLLLSLNSIAAYGQPAQNRPEAAPIILENNTILYLELAKTVDAKKAKPGDPVPAKLLADVVSQGKVVLHHDMKVMGHVTEAQPYSKENHESRLGFVIDKFMLKNGHELAFTSDLLAIGAAPRVEISPAPNGPASLGMNPASTQDRHYPAPRGGPSVKTISPPTGDSQLKGDMEQHAKSVQGFASTDIDGISLAPSPKGTGRVVVSMQHTVKLEDGVRLELRVTRPNQANKDQVQAP